MTEALSESREQVDRFLQREKKLQRWTWISLLVPVAVFVTLFGLAGRELRTLTLLKEQSREQKEQIEGNQRELASQEQQLAVNRLALGAVNLQRSGPAPTLMYYRSSIAPLLSAALGQLGFNAPDVKEVEGQANPTLPNKPVDTLIYGCAVSEQDLRLIAAALTKAGLPIRRIAPAVKKKDPLLVQLVASVKADSTKPPLDPAAWKKTTPTCSATS